MKNVIAISTAVLLVFLTLSCNKQKEGPEQIVMTPNTGELVTGQIQQAVDSLAGAGGGTVYFPAGKYISGRIYMKSNITLKFEKGATLQGSDNLEDYGEWKWTNALITGDNLKNIAIVGEGKLDGIDLRNPEGEAGMRGPHCIRLTNCDSITLKDFTIIRSANWAMNLRHCSHGYVENVKVYGGWDALHTRFCDNFDVRGCDFRTGDDCFAGNDNQDFSIQDCKINTSCNAFRFGCLNLNVKNCSIWGPGEYEHIKQQRNNTLSAFVHFSPKDEDPKLKSGNWLIQDVTIDHVDHVYNYNYRDGLWQTGEPATDVTFENLKVTGVKKSFNITADQARQLQLTIRNASLGERENTELTDMVWEGRDYHVPAFFNITSFDKLVLQNVSFHTNDNSNPVLMAKDGNTLEMEDVTYSPESIREPYLFKNIEDIIRK